jgi:hypothetical protein
MPQAGLAVWPLVVWGLSLRIWSALQMSCLSDSLTHGLPIR